MKIQKTSSHKKVIIIILITTLVVVCGGIALGVTNNWWQPKKEVSTNHKNERDGSDENSDSQPSKEQPSPPVETPVPSEQSIVIPPAEKPSMQDQFPIENSHYRIDKKSSNSYEVTLYAILNTPSQRDEYISQLRQFKKEALDYMKERYGSIDNLSFTWNPPEAKDL